MRIQQSIINHHINFPDDSLDTITAKFKKPRSTVSGIIQGFYDKKRRIYVVASITAENTFFVFNNLNERVFYTDIHGCIIDHSHFSEREKIELKKLGFRLDLTRLMYA